MADNLEDDHQRLVRAGEALDREHQRLHDRPNDLEAHAAAVHPTPTPIAMTTANRRVARII